MSSPTTLYHYTTAAGLIGIVRGRSLWVTASVFLNDMSEVAFGGDLLRRELMTQLESTDSPLPVRRVLGQLDAGYLAPDSRIRYREDNVFVTSFSETDDQLTLWRGYAGKGGFCVGFDTDLLQAFFERYPRQSTPPGTTEEEHELGIRANTGLSGEIAKVTYGEEEARDSIRAVALGLVEAMNDPTTTHWPSGLLRELVKLKHDAFRDEREVRLIVNETGDLAPRQDLRVTNAGTLAAHHAISFPHEAIRSITIAPSSNSGQVRSALSSLLSDGGRGGWGHVTIRDCDIPFAW